MIIGHLWLITKRNSSRFDVVIYRFLSRNLLYLTRWEDTVRLWKPQIWPSVSLLIRKRDIILTVFRQGQHDCAFSGLLMDCEKFKGKKE